MELGGPRKVKVPVHWVILASSQEHPRKRVPELIGIRMSLLILLLVTCMFMLYMPYMHKRLVAFVSACILGHTCISFCSKGKNN